MSAQTYFRLCLFVPLLVPLPFLVFNWDEGLASLFIGSLVFGMPPYVLVFVLPLLFLFGRMSERQIVMGVIFFPILYPLVFGLFWSIVPNFISVVTITLSNTSHWVFTSIMIPAAYTALFLSGNIMRKMWSGEMGLLEQRAAAILCADVKTGSQSSDIDNMESVASHVDYAQICDPIITDHGGQRANCAGDSVVAEFASVINAVKCGLSLQQKFKEINREQSPQDKIQLGIGINLGDVKSKGNDIRGPGVIVAASLQEQTAPGEIYISGTVYDRIKKKLIFTYDFLGEQSIQTIDNPVRVYRLTLEATAPVAETTAEVKLVIPDKPSIAVLPFDNISADPEQDYFSDGLTEDILTDLSKLAGLLVISRHSTFTYKGQYVTAQQVSQNLGVRYILEGSVRKAGNRIRVTAQLIDAIKDDHIWAERFDRELKDVFTLQDEISKKIVSALEIKLSSIEKKRLGHQGTKNIEAHDIFLRAKEQFYLFTPKGIANALELYSQAIGIDPNFAQAYAWKSRCHVFLYAVGFNLSLEETIIPGLTSAKKAVEIDNLLPIAHASLGWALLWNREIEQATFESKRAVNLDPNFDDGHVWLSIIFSSAGKGDEALESIEKAIRLNPYYSVLYIFAHGLAYFVLGKYEKALSHFTKGMKDNSNFIPNLIFRTGILGLLDRKEEAYSSADKLVKLYPNYTGFVASIFNDKQLAETFNKGLNKAGLDINYLK